MDVKLLMMIISVVIRTFQRLCLFYMLKIFLSQIPTRFETETRPHSCCPRGSFWNLCHPLPRKYTWDVFIFEAGHIEESRSVKGSINILSIWVDESGDFNCFLRTGEQFHSKAGPLVNEKNYFYVYSYRAHSVDNFCLLMPKLWFVASWSQDVWAGISRGESRLLPLWKLDAFDSGGQRGAATPLAPLLMYPLILFFLFIFFHWIDHSRTSFVSNRPNYSSQHEAKYAGDGPTSRSKASIGLSKQVLRPIRNEERLNRSSAENDWQEGGAQRFEM